MLSNYVVDDKAYDRLETEWANLVAAAEWLWQTAAVQGEEVGDEEAARSLNDLAKALRNFLRFGGRLDELGQLRTRADKAMRAVNNRGNASDMTKAALSDPATFWREIIIILDFAKDVHQKFHSGMTNDLTEFRHAVGVIWSQFSASQDVERLRSQNEEARKVWRAWRAYARQYTLFWRGFLASLPERQRRAERAYDVLGASGSNPSLTSRAFFTTITEVLQDYPRFHDEVPINREQEEGQFLLNLVHNIGYVESLVTTTHALWAEMNNLESASNDLIANLIQDIREILNGGV